MQVDMHVAKTTLSSLVVEALNGNEVVIAKSGQPLVKIVPINAVMQPRTLGTYKDQGFNLGVGINAGDNEIATLFNEGAFIETSITRNAHLSFLVNWLARAGQTCQRIDH